MRHTDTVDAPLDALPGRVDHLIVGAGFAGLCASIKLTEAGEHDHVLIERGHDVGGTWRDNTYPGAACDVPSQLYSFSFAPNPAWSRSFSPQPEILAYLRQVAAAHGIGARTRFETTLTAAAWDEDAQEWVVDTTAGRVRARTLITGTGGLSEPRLPDIEGLADFRGDLFHSARWDHTTALQGKRVAVIGTGASAIQIVPEVAKSAGHVDVHQRTAPYVIPRSDRRYTRLERLLFRHVPALARAYRAGIYWGRETCVPAFTWQPRLVAPAELLARAHLARSIDDPDLRERLTPSYRLGCKRVLISNDYYPALARDHVDLVTDRIVRATPTGLVTADADGHETERPVDVIVVATGFHTQDLPIADRVRGRDGRLLADEWRAHGMSAYRGTTVHGFPNLFTIVGANTTLGHSSMVFVIESQVAYVVDALRTLRERDLAAVEPSRAAQESFNAALQRRMRRTVWSTGGCASWYLDAHGRNTALWPRTTVTLRRQLARFDVEAYDVEHHHDQEAVSA